MPPATRPTLFVIFSSNASLAGRAALAYKRIAYWRVDLPPVAHWAIVRALGFRRRTVPALLLEGRRVQGTRAITRALDEYRPEIPLFPPDGPRRRAIEEAERWGEETLQPLLRTVQPYALLRDRAAIATLARGARLGVPPRLLAASAWPAVRLGAAVNGSTQSAVREALRQLPGHLERVDRWIADGLLDGEALTAADIQIASTIRTLMWFEDLGPAIEPRPAGALARRVFPEVPGRIGRVLPADAVEAFRRA